jgi:ribonucleoside-diphosphate reductase alpha chain
MSIDHAKDNLLTIFAKTTLKDRYLIDNETPQEMFFRIASYYANDIEHAQRLYNYMSNLWFMPATPILANGGLDRGLPISCYLNETDDNLESIDDLLSENLWLARNAGGIGSNWSNVRSNGEPITNMKTASGVIPFLKIQDSQTLAISQGGLRRGSSAVYMHISHPEIEEFVDLRRPIGDPNRRCLNLNHGIIISDEFMQAVQDGKEFNLISPVTKQTLSKINARELWIKILNARIETGEPYLLFIDNVNRQKPEHLKYLNVDIKTSNLCNEIVLPTGLDHKKKHRTAVCCLSSLNLEYYRLWQDNKDFVQDILYFLDNVLSDFIAKAPDKMERAKYSAMRERSIGLGVMGFHSFLQSENIPFESVMAKSWNKKIFSTLKEQADLINAQIADSKGECPDLIDARLVGYNGSKKRFSHIFAIAPTANISNICGESSPGIEPYAANVFTQKTLSGSFVIKNKNLKKLLQEKDQDNDSVWSSIATSGGSVQHLDFLTPEKKAIFKTCFEIDQQWVIEHAADRQPFIDQGQSVNLFLLGNADKAILHKLHFSAWQKGMKGLYYCRSRSIQRADTISTKTTQTKAEAINLNNPDECLSCQ